MKTPVWLHYDKFHLPRMSDELFAKICRDAPEFGFIRCESEEEFVAALPDADMAATWKFRPEWTALAPKLKVVATPAAGREMIKVEPREGLETTFGTFHGELMAETVVGLMLAFARGIKKSFDWRGKNDWPRQEISAQMFSLRGSHAVIVGFGHIGKWIGRLLKPFGVRLTGVNRSDLARPEYFGGGDIVVSITDLDTVLPSADHLILALPGTTGTDKIIDKRRLQLLSNKAFVYNVGRGNSVDAAALAEQLQNGALAGAGLDVFEREPLAADSPLRACDNVILLPHVSAIAPNYLDLFFVEFINRIRNRND